MASREFRATAALIVGLLALFLPAGPAAGQQSNALNSLTNDFKIRLWNTSTKLRGTFGYKDNMGLSHTNRQGSLFWDSGGELMVFRMPTGSWTFSFFATADDTRYFGAKTDQNEQVILAAAQAMRSFSWNGSAGFGLSYFFQNQILDVTADQTNQSAISQVMGNNFIGRWFVKKNFKPGWLQLDMSGGRGLMAAPQDSYWQFGPRLSLGHNYGHGSDLTLSYQWNHQMFDTRQQVSSQGYAVAGTSLQFSSQTAELNWHHVWDQSNHWHTVLTAGCDLNQDNGSGYFNYSQYRLAPRLEYRAETWTLSGFVRGGYYDYPVQTISPGSAIARRKTYLTTGLHAEKQLCKKFKLSADYTYDRSLSNVNTDAYYDNTISLGFDWQL